jgi:hypothetical protein
MTKMRKEGIADQWRKKVFVVEGKGEYANE